jgi:hypothetical protein
MLKFVPGVSQEIDHLVDGLHSLRRKLEVDGERISAKPRRNATDNNFNQ